MKELQKYHNKMENFYYGLKFNIIYKIKMTTYYEYGVNLTDNQKSKLASAITDNSPLTLRLKHSHLKGSDELMLTKTQINKIKNLLQMEKEVISRYQKRKLAKWLNTVETYLHHLLLLEQKYYHMQ